MTYFADEKLTIRDMEGSDAPVFTREEAAQGWHADISKYLMRLKDREKGRCVSLTAEYDGYPAGYVHVYLIGEGGPLSGKGLPEIVDFGVLEKYRRRGIGTRLMDTAEQIAARYADTVWLCVGLHNGYGSAQRMYVRRGYIPDGTGVWYRGRLCTPYDTIYTNDDDMVLYMYKKLPAHDRMMGMADRFAGGAAEILGEKLAGIYLHGSAAMGCFRWEGSDLDLLAVVREDLEDAEKRAFMDMLIRLDAEGPAGGIEMSIVKQGVCAAFVYPTPYILHYSRMHSERYRRDPEEYIRRMQGTDRDLAAHFAVIRSRGCCLYGLPVRDVFGPVPQWCFLDSLLHDIEGAEDRITGEAMYLILNLARVLGWLRERRILSKTEGGEWGLKNIPAKYGPPLRVALREYREGTDERYDPEALRRYAAYMMDQIRQLAQDLGDEGPELASAADAGTVAGLACMLWPEHTQEELEAEFEALLENKDAAVFLYRKQGKVVGFAQCGLRHDYVEGTETSPVGYLEGIYVTEGERRRGIARRLLAACRVWAKSRGCTEFASDCSLENTQSRLFHQAVGFREANRIIAFVRKL